MGQLWVRQWCTVTRMRSNTISDQSNPSFSTICLTLVVTRPSSKQTFRYTYSQRQCSKVEHRGLSRNNTGVPPLLSYRFVDIINYSQCSSNYWILFLKKLAENSSSGDHFIQTIRNLELTFYTVCSKWQRSQRRTSVTCKINVMWRRKKGFSILRAPLQCYPHK